MTDSAVRAIGTRTNNAQLMADCNQLGYITDDDYVADVTYGLGRFWKDYCPPMLVASDIDPDKSPSGESIDFTALPYTANEFDVVVLDAPYKLSGTSRVSSDPGYGIGKYMPLRDRMNLIFAGVDECARVVRDDGLVLVKAQDQVVSGKVVWQTLDIVEYASFCRLDLIDMLHVQAYRPQPAGTAQLHARRDYSTLLVFKKIGAK